MLHFFSFSLKKMGFVTDAKNECMEIDSDFQLMRSLFVCTYKQIPPWKVRAEMRKTNRLNHSSSFREFKKGVDETYLETLSCGDHDLFLNIAHFVEYLGAIRNTRYTRSYTFVLSRLIGLVLTEPVRSKLPNIVKMQILEELSFFVTHRALKTAEDGSIIPRNVWYATFLYTSAYSFALLCSEYKIARDIVIQEIENGFKK